MKQKTLKIIKIIIYIILLIVLFFSIFINKKFGNITFELLLYNTTNVKGANMDVVFEGLIFVFIPVILIILLFIIIKKIRKNKINKIIYKILQMTFVITSLCTSIKLLNIDDYIILKSQKSTLFEDYYISAKDVELEFPNKKRNLIHIFVESLESTNFSKKNGGILEKTYIPNLEKLALNNISFSNTDKLGGAYQLENTNWTIAALIAQTSGVPLKMSLNKESDNSFLGVYALGDILKDNGYTNYFMIGSDADFGGRNEYFENHNYIVYDYLYAMEKELIEEDYHVWWGYEDQKLFEFSKEKIKEISKKEEPFNFTLLTVDTHFTDGYMDDSCEDVFDSKYANAIYCSDSKINSFINWIKKQDFYEDTTIVITGDHLTMQTNFYDIPDNYSRGIYNVIINSPIETKYQKNRIFTSFDFFPTTLASLNVKIEGNKLGLGVNLYSGDKTLAEKLGFDYLNTEIQKKSLYYDKYIISNEK